MKKCPNCQALNETDDKFCRTCGQKLEHHPEPEKKKRKPWIIGGILLATAVCAAVFFLFNREEKPDYQETIAMAEKYLEELDYSKAEEFFLEARKIDPKQQEPYEELYRIYTIQELPDKAEEIRQSASENLEEEDRENFENIADMIEVDEKPDPERTTVTELGTLDYPPVTLDGKSWLLIRDGKYSFLYPDGSLQEATDMDRVALFASHKDDDTVVLTACFSNETDYQKAGSYSDGVYKSVPACGGGTIANTPYILNSQDQVELDPDIADLFGASGAFDITAPLVVSRTKEVQGDYYIFNPADQKLYGPYDENSAAAFYKRIPQLNIPYSGGLIQQAFSPFWVKNENPEMKENGISDLYTVFSKDGSKSESGYSDVMITDPYSIGVYRSKRLYLLDENLNPLYDGIFEAGVFPIDGKAPVKVDGQWKLIDLNKKAEDGKKEEEPKTENSSSDQQKADSVFSEYQGEYIKRGGRWSSTMKIASDGSVDGQAQIGYAYENTDEYPQGTVHQMEYTARFEVVQKSTSEEPAKIRLTGISLKKPVGTEEIRDGFRYVADDGEAFYLHNDQEYLLYPAGTRYGDLPQYVFESYFPQESADNTLPSPYLILCESPELVFIRN